MIIIKICSALSKVETTSRSLSSNDDAYSLELVTSRIERQNVMSLRIVSHNTMKDDRIVHVYVFEKTKK